MGKNKKGEQGKFTREQGAGKILKRSRENDKKIRREHVDGALL